MMLAKLLRIMNSKLQNICLNLARVLIVPSSLMHAARSILILECQLIVKCQLIVSTTASSRPFCIQLNITKSFWFEVGNREWILSSEIWKLLMVYRYIVQTEHSGWCTLIGMWLGNSVWNYVAPAWEMHGGTRGELKNTTNKRKQWLWAKFKC